MFDKLKPVMPLQVHEYAETSVGGRALDQAASPINVISLIIFQKSYAVVMAERLGHADATLFSNLYSHVTPTMQREAAERIGAALFGE